MPLSFWWHAFAATVYLINRLYSPTLFMQSPFQIIHNKVPDYHYLHVFRCTYFPYLRPYNSNKLEFRSKKYIFLGYSTNHKGYKCLGTNGRVYIADTVRFNECEFPYLSLFSSVFDSQPVVVPPLSMLQSSIPVLSPPPSPPP